MKRVSFDYESYIGKKINNLEILGIEKKGNSYYYKCKCDCGNFTSTRAYQVLHEKIKSCGCYKKSYERCQQQKELARQMGLKTRKHEEKCDYCGAPNHFAKGLCHNCYERLRRNGTLEYVKKKEEN